MSGYSVTDAAAALHGAGAAAAGSAYSNVYGQAEAALSLAGNALYGKAAALAGSYLPAGAALVGGLLSGQPGTVITGRNMGGLQFAVVVEEQHEDKLTITEHPVEQGAKVNDHAYVMPAMLTIRAGVSDAGGVGKAREMYEKLLDMMRKREPFDIVTGKRLYENMLLENVSTSTDSQSEHSLIVTAQCREVIIVRTQVSSVPPRKRHKNAARTGGVSDKGQKQAKARPQSMLKAALG